MLKEIVKALIIAFLSWVIPIAYNAITHGGLITFFGGVTREEFGNFVKTAITDNAPVGIILARSGRALEGPTEYDGSIRIADNKISNKSEQQWEIVHPQ